MKIPAFLKDYAHYLTHMRIDENAKRYEGTHKQRTGVVQSKLLGSCDREYYTEYIGILSELIIRLRVEKNRNCVAYKASSMIKHSHLATNDADIVVYRAEDERHLSIKGCEGSMKANKQAMDTENVDLVSFVVYQDPDNCEIKYYSPEEVRSWDVGSGFSDFYYKELC